ncbi:hypothetical protein B0H16DRAFT_1237077, partial [Mycena metata]
FYSTSFNDVTTVIDGYDSRATLPVYLLPRSSTVPFFRLVSRTGGHSLYTANTAERRRKRLHHIGVGAYIYPSQICGSAPFYRL